MPVGAAAALDGDQRLAPGGRLAARRRHHRLRPDHERNAPGSPALLPRPRSPATPTPNSVSWPATRSRVSATRPTARPTRSCWRTAPAGRRSTGGSTGSVGSPTGSARRIQQRQRRRLVAEAASDFDLKGSSADGTTFPGPCAINCTNGSNVGNVYPDPVWGTNGTGETYSFHTNGANILFADGSVKFVNAGVNIVTYAALVTRAGGEAVDGSDY